MADPTLRGLSPMGCIKAERIKQDVKWGEQNHNDPRWLSINACIENLEYELIQVAAVCVAWVECIRRQDQALNNKHKNPPE